VGGIRCINPDGYHSILRIAGHQRVKVRPAIGDYDAGELGSSGEVVQGCLALHSKADQQ
jgi:hypothetical protein